MSEMKITALAPWFGAKRTLAPRIVAELGPHRAYWEPFAGSMAVLLAKPVASMETVNDLHGDLVNLARVIQHQTLGPMLYRRVRRWIQTKPTFEDAASATRQHANAHAPSEPDIDRAFAYFVAAWNGRNGCAGTQSYNQGFCRRFTKSGGHAATRWAAAVDSIPAWRRRMRAVTVLSECGIGLLEKIEDAAGVAIYCDPPYLVKGASYVHDFDDADHQRLADLLARFKSTRVVVSYYAHQRLAELYPGWTLVSCPTTKAMVNQGQRGGKGSTMAPEVLLINGPSYTTPPASGRIVEPEPITTDLFTQEAR